MVVRALLLVWTLCILWGNRAEARQHYLPVVLVHGINNQPRDWDIFAATVKAARTAQGSGRLIQLHSPFDGVPGSWLALREQISWFERQLRLLVELSPREFEDGFDMVCHSQGAVICRALIQDTEDLKVRSFISLAGPQLGVYGEGFLPAKLFPEKVREFTVQNAWEIAYTKWAQLSLSPANLWHDPFHEAEFLERNLFLPAYLGLTGSSNERDRRRKNFLKLTRASFLVGNFTSQTYDLGIDPWFSGIFGYYDENGSVRDIWSQDFFLDDTFGLRTLHESGRLVIQAVTDVLHDDWIYDQYVIRHHVMPYLSPPRHVSSIDDDIKGEVYQ